MIYFPNEKKINYIHLNCFARFLVEIAQLGHSEQKKIKNKLLTFKITRGCGPRKGFAFEGGREG